MDRLDVAILRSLYGPTPAATTGIPTAATIARDLGVHGATVKRRLARLRGSGILRSVRVAPAAAALGATAHLVEFRFSDARGKKRGFATLADSPSVVETHDFVGDDLAAWIYAFDGEKPARVIASLERGAGAQRATILQEWTGAPTRPLHALDTRILAALAPDGHITMRALERRTRLTAKTIRARLRALGKAQAFISYPSISFGNVTGSLAYVLRAKLAPRRRRAAHAALLSAFPDHICASVAQTDEAYLYLIAASSAEMARVLDGAHEIDGVEAARVNLVRDLASYPEKIRARLDAAPRTMVATGGRR